MLEERIVTQHPQGKKGMNITVERYEMVKECIIRSLKGTRGLTYTELRDEAEKKLPQFDGSISWYIECVKLDLEARGVLRRVRDGKREFYELTD